MVNYFKYNIFMKESTLDNIDTKLLELLQTDASQSNQSLAEKVHISPPTCLRRIKALVESGLIERQIAILNTDKLAVTQGYGLTALVEITLDRQGAEHLEAFETRVIQDSAVQQCYRVSPGPDFCLIVYCANMPTYLALANRLFTQDANVRNVKAFFSTKRSKFDLKIDLKA
jgi:Lrp/AsnC family transcriptional regulator, leucine-responsive regulatory protein